MFCLLGSFKNKQGTVGPDLRHSLFRLNVQVNFSYLVPSETGGISSIGRLSPVAFGLGCGLGMGSKRESPRFFDNCRAV